jgi:hypothetical protein
LIGDRTDVNLQQKMIRARCYSLNRNENRMTWSFSFFKL